VDERWFLNLAGFHGRAYIVAYVEDTTKRALMRDCDDDGCDCAAYNFEPRMILEMADCDDRINLEFDVDSEAGRANSLHKLDTLISALRIFREGSWRSSSRTTGVSASSASSRWMPRAGRSSPSISGRLPP
jgi:hypothetical protein